MDNKKKTPDIQEQKFIELSNEIKNLRNEIIDLIEAMNRNTRDYVNLMNNVVNSTNQLINLIISNKL